MSELAVLLLTSLAGGAMLCAVWYGVDRYERWLDAREAKEDCTD